MDRRADTRTVMVGTMNVEPEMDQALITRLQESAQIIKVSHKIAQD